MTAEQKADIERCARIVYDAQARLNELNKDVHFSSESESLFIEVQVAEAELLSAQTELTLAKQYRLPEVAQSTGE